MIIQITLLALLDTLLSNNAFAQETLHDRRLSEVVTQTRRSQEGPQIDVGDYPTKIAVNEDTNKAYVANYDSGTVSVIDGDSDTKIGEDIPVGGSPVDIAVNEDTETAYVANEGSDSVSVIDYTANELVAGIKFHVNPFNSGYIQCDDTANFSLDDLTAASPTEQLVYVRSGTGCTAKPNEGFEFVSWEENLEGNSTQPISVSRPSSSLDSFLEFLHLKSADKPEATLNITKFGTFTANFKELPPVLPSEYWIPLYGIIASTIVGWSIPSIIGWAKSKRDVRKLNYYHKQITSLYGDGKLDEKDIGPLDRLRSKIVNAYSEGKINDKHYGSLRNEISVLYEKIFRKRIDDALDNTNPSNNKTTQDQLAQIRNDVKYAYSEGKLNQKHYNFLSKDILDFESKESY